MWAALIPIAMDIMPMIPKLISFVEKTFAGARAAGELTPEQEAAYQQHQADVLAARHAQIDPDPGT